MSSYKTHIQNYIRAISQLPEKQRTKGIKLMLKIFNNITNDPTNIKYHKLNFMKISNKFKESPVFMQLLTASGFSKSIDGKRLLFDMNNLYYLKLAHHALIHSTSQNKKSHDTSHQISHTTNNNTTHESRHETVQELIDAGFTHQQERNIPDISISGCHKLIAMGFDKVASIEAIFACNNDVNAAAEFLMQNPTSDNEFISCNGINDCVQVQKLYQVMNDYDNNNYNKNDLHEKYSHRTVEIMDYFHHFLSYHNQSDIQFQQAYELFETQCNATKCTQLVRHYRNRECENKDNIVNVIQDIFDTIHCHIRHGYDIGVRLNSTDHAEIDDTKYDVDDGYIDGKLINLKCILERRRHDFKQITECKRNLNQNKFSSNLNQICTEIENKSIPQYSFSFAFTYHEQCKHCNVSSPHMNGNIHLTYSDLYIPVKNISLKEELISNDICSIGIDSWNAEMEKAMQLKNTSNARKTYAKVSKWFDPHIIENYKLDHPSQYGYKDHDPITKNHLLVVIIYCSYDIFQRKFTETYRKHQDENLSDLIERHSNYHHFAKYLKESVLVFSQLYMNSNIKRFYHGINKEMVFKSMAEPIYGPLSTTCSWTVAVGFSCNTGLIVDMVPNPWSKHFVCDWLSPFPYEQEVLFISMWGQMNFLNITHTQFGWNLEQYVLGLRLIDSATTGYYTMYDHSDFLKICAARNGKKWNRNVAELELKCINKSQKQLCLALLYHQLYKNGYKGDKSSRTRKFANLNIYVEQLLQQICSNKIQVTIEWKTMNVNHLKEVYEGDSGYIGYSFLRSLFCTKDYEGIDFNVIYSLFPQLEIFTIRGLSSIASAFLDDIYQFIKQSKTITLKRIELDILYEFGWSNIFEQHDKYLQKFNTIGFQMEILQNRNWGNRITLTQSNFVGV
eukprot:515564_1